MTTHIPGAAHIDARPIIDNVTNRSVCDHCHGGPEYKSGFVCIDDPTSHGYVAPCPMCQQGAQAERVQHAEHGGRYWGRVFDLSEVTWNNGLTSQHVKRCRVADCRRPAVATVCDPHRASQGKPVGAEAVRRMVQHLAKQHGASLVRIKHRR
jgi:hypothetical protein